MANKFIKALSNTKTRTLVLFAGGLITVSVVVAVVSSGNDGPSSASGQSRISKVPSYVESTPGAETSESYQELQKEQNRRGTEQASKTGSSFIPTITNASSTNKKSLLGGEEQLQNLFSNEAKEEKAPAEEKVNPKVARLIAEQKRIEAEQAQAVKRRRTEVELQRLKQANDARLKAIEKAADAMEDQAKDAIASWVNFEAQSHVSGSWAKLEDLTLKEAQAQNAAAAKAIDEHAQSQFSLTNNLGDKNSKDKLSGKLILKAGDIIFAVLETAINSDEPGPIMAKVVSGQFKGAKLVGKISEFKSKASKHTEKLMLSFYAMNDKSYPESFKIDAVAIDPNTARTAIASDVDHHYLYRYGSLFAATFLEGYAKAVASSGATSTTNTTQSTGATTTTSNRPALTGKEQIFEGLSKVGEAWGNAIAPNFDRPPTITIDSGTGVGILFTNDVELGIPIETKATTATTIKENITKIIPTTAANTQINTGVSISGK